MSAVPGYGQRRPSPVDELLEAIDHALDALRYDKTLRAHPAAFEALIAHHTAARAVVEAASYPAAVRRLVDYQRRGAVLHSTRRALDNPVAEAVLTAIARAYRLDP